jgi:hypothetical protein
MKTSILEAGIDFSSSTCALSLFISESLGNFHAGGIDSCQESMPRNRIPAALNFLKDHLWICRQESSTLDVKRCIIFVCTYCNTVHLLYAEFSQRMYFLSSFKL